MKRLYQDPRWINLGAARFRKSLIRAEYRAERRAYYSTLALSGTHLRMRDGGAEIQAPRRFSLIANTDETLLFFELIGNCIKQRRSVYLDLTEVTELGPEAIAYLLSYIEYTRAMGRMVSIAGNNPQDQQAHAQLIDMGFYSHVYCPTKFIPQAESDILAIESGITPSTETAARFKQFAVRKLDLPDDRHSTLLYGLSLECMENTTQHAYGGSRNTPNRWWATAIFARSDAELHFIFIDNGEGIPTTVRRKGLIETIATVTDSVFSLERYTDHTVLLDTMNGGDRSRTYEEFRGKGLPSLVKALREGAIQSLRVLSRHGMADCGTQEASFLRSPFRGTLLAWSVRSAKRSKDVA